MRRLRYGSVVDSEQGECRMWYGDIVFLSASQVRKQMGDGSRLVDFGVCNAREDKQR
jgi:hypothetical protein